MVVGSQLFLNRLGSTVIIRLQVGTEHPRIWPQCHGAYAGRGAPEWTSGLLKNATGSTVPLANPLA